MNKKFILVCVIFLLAPFGFAQDTDDFNNQGNFSSQGNFGGNENSGDSVISVGAGPELNMNSREGFAFGAGLSIDYQLPFPSPELAAGAVVTASSNFDDTFVIEATAMARWYFMGTNYTGLFAQVDLGMHYITERDVSLILFQGGVRAGYRLPMSDSFYIEPYGRFGYPHFIGIGVLAGMRFNLSSDPSTSRADNRAESRAESRASRRASNRSDSLDDNSADSMTDSNYAAEE